MSRARHSRDIREEVREGLKKITIGQVRSLAPGSVDTATAEFCCLECGRKITRGRSGTEYGHLRGVEGSTRDGRCSRRPASVDPRAPGSNPPGE